MNFTEILEFIKSEIRYRIMELFRLNIIEIPFPQRDLWIRNAPIIHQNNGKLVSEM